MYKCVVTSLLVAAAIILCPASAWAQEDPDAPIATAPSESVLVVVEELSGEPELLPPPVPPELRPPWLTKETLSSELSGVATIGVQDGYFYRYYGFDVANSKPTSQATLSGSYGDWNVETGGSKLLSSRDSSQSSERLANEMWVGLSYRPEVETPIGRFRFDFAVVYRALDHGQGVFATRDDSTELIAGVGYPMTFGPFEIMPYVISVKSNPVGYNNSLYWAGAGLAGKLLLRDYGVVLSADLMDWHNVNSYTAVIHRNVTTGSLTGSKQLPFRGLTGTVGVWFSRYSEQDSRFDLLVERDGRMLRTAAAPGSSKGKYVATPYAKIAYAF